MLGVTGEVKARARKLPLTVIAAFANRPARATAATGHRNSW
jgi:hypothetical protein